MKIIPYLLLLALGACGLLAVEDVNKERAKNARLCAVLAHANADSLVVWGEDGQRRIDPRAMAWVAVVQERYRRAYEDECP